MFNSEIIGNFLEALTILQNFSLWNHIKKSHSTILLIFSIFLIFYLIYGPGHYATNYTYRSPYIVCSFVMFRPGCGQFLVTHVDFKVNRVSVPYLRISIRSVPFCEIHSKRINSVSAFCQFLNLNSWKRLPVK